MVKKQIIFGYIGLLLIFLTGCGAVQPQSNVLIITIFADGNSEQVEVEAGTSAREALEVSGIALDPLDKSDPPLYTVLQNGDEIHLTRVVEEYIVEQIVIPYDTQVLRNESLEEGERRLIQPGQNGKQETTYRVLFEDGVEVSRTISSTSVIEPAVSEIVMVGSQAPFTVIPIPGILRKDYRMVPVPIHGQTAMFMLGNSKRAKKMEQVH